MLVFLNHEYKHQYINIWKDSEHVNHITTYVVFLVEIRPYSIFGLGQQSTLLNVYGQMAAEYNISYNEVISHYVHNGVLAPELYKGSTINALKYIHSTGSIFLPNVNEYTKVFPCNQCNSNLSSSHIDENIMIVTLTSVYNYGVYPRTIINAFIDWKKKTSTKYIMPIPPEKLNLMFLINVNNK